MALYSTNHAKLIPLRPDQAHLTGDRGMELQGLSIEEEAEQTQELRAEALAQGDEALEQVEPVAEEAKLRSL